MGHIWSVCKTTILFAKSKSKLCSSVYINLDDSNDHILFLVTNPSNSFHNEKRLYLSNGGFYDIIVDTDSIEFIIWVGKLKSLSPDVTIKTNKVYISSIASHKPPIVERCNLLFRDGKSSSSNSEFLVSDCGPSM